MKTRLAGLVAVLSFVCSALVSASSPGENALWIEVREKGDQRTVIAMTELVARLLLESDRPGGHFMKDGEKGLLTREMLKAVLDGDEESIEMEDEDGSDVRLYMDDLDVPDGDEGTGKLVIETYKSGSRTFRMALPEIEVEVSNEEQDGIGSLQVNIGWKGLLPLLRKKGGALYVLTDDGETEVWVYFD